jgi:hypothetical protein
MKSPQPTPSPYPAYVKFLAIYRQDYEHHTAKSVKERRKILKGDKRKTRHAENIPALTTICLKRC